ncbi:MAG: hypothetical protein JSS65_13165 [Armatimonadetes bacterium]|nr:hypothetical protein [Armatimonadota bacterium]
MSVAVWAVAFATAPLACQAKGGVLYDAAKSVNMADATWRWSHVGEVTASKSGEVSSLPELRDRDGWWISLSRGGVPESGVDYTLAFELAEEIHTSKNRAGLTLAVTDSMGRSVVVNFWSNEAWLGLDQPLTGHGESIQLSTPGRHSVTVSIGAESALVQVDGQSLGRVPLRDFSATSTDLDGYLQPGTLFVGDASTAAGAKARIDAVRWNTRGLDWDVVSRFLGWVAVALVTVGLVFWIKWNLGSPRPTGRVYISRL